MSLNDLSFRDLEWVVGIRSVRSLRDFARLKQAKVAHVSKVFQHIEERLGAKIFHRSPAGIEITEDGAELINLCEELLSYGEKIRDFGKRKQQTETQTLTVAALAFIQTFLVTDSLKGFKERFRLLEINPNLVPQLQLLQHIDLFVHLGRIEWPASIQTVEVGEVHFDFYMHSKYVGKNFPLKELYKTPFILPTYLGSGRYIVGNDRCPIPMHLRIKGDETTTSQQAVKLLERDRQLAFLPELAVKEDLAAGRLRKLKFQEFPQVSEKLYLSVRMDTVPQKTFNGLLKQLRENLLGLNA